MDSLKDLVQFNPDPDWSGFDWTYDISASEPAVMRESTTFREASKTDTIQAYVASLQKKGKIANFGWPDFEKSGFNTEGMDRASFGTVSSYLRRNGKLGTPAPARANTFSGDMGAAEPAVIEPPKEVDRTSLSSGLNKVIDLFADAEDAADSVEGRTAAKYDAVYDTIFRTVIGRSVKNHAFVGGDAGVGKSYYAERALKAGLARFPRKSTFRRGNIGKSQSDVVAFLFMHKDNEVIVLDDCDAFLNSTDEGVQNTLKAALDPDGGEVSVAPAIRKKVGSLLKTLAESQGAAEGNRFREGIDDDDDDEGGDGADGDQYKIPASFDFTSSLIMISNMRMSEVDKAIISRCSVCELTLTREEFLCQLKKVLPNLQPKKTRIPPEELNWAKKCCYVYLCAALEAATRGVPLGKNEVKVGVPLEFRLILDLCDRWIAITDKYRESLGTDDLAKIEKAAALDFCRNALLPRLYGDTR